MQQTFQLKFYPSHFCNHWHVWWLLWSYGPKISSFLRSIWSAGSSISRSPPWSHCTPWNIPDMALAWDLLPKEKLRTLCLCIRVLGLMVTILRQCHFRQFHLTLLHLDILFFMDWQIMPKALPTGILWSLLFPLFWRPESLLFVGIATMFGKHALLGVKRESLIHGHTQWHQF